MRKMKERNLQECLVIIVWVLFSYSAKMEAIQSFMECRLEEQAIIVRSNEARRFVFRKPEMLRTLNVENCTDAGALINEATKVCQKTNLR